MNKKAFIKTLEAIIAILFILGFIYMITPKEMEISEEIPKNVRAAQEFILQEILYNDSLRDCVINSISGGCKEMGLYFLFCGDINLLTEKNTPYGYAHTCEICDIEELSCLTEDLPKDRSIYVDSAFISSAIVEESKVVRLYFWREEEIPVKPPEKTCQNQGYYCCDECEAGTEHNEYDKDCPGEQVCCEICWGTCAEKGGTCCSAGEVCENGQFVSSTDCGTLCCVDGSCVTEQKFYIKNSAGENVASLSDRGNIVLKGICIAGGDCIAPAGSFVIKDSTDNTVTYVDSNGNLCIETGDCSDKADNCDAPGDGSFIIKNGNNVNVVYINAVGDLCLIGTLTENDNP